MRPLRWACPAVHGNFVANESVRDGWFRASSEIPSTDCPRDSGLSLTNRNAMSAASTIAPATIYQPARQLPPAARSILSRKGETAKPAKPDAASAITDE